MKQREIKFRAWDGAVMQHDFYVWSFGNEIYDLDEDGDDVVVDWPLMQYTGLKDKNGVDIYEGDIVRCEKFDRMNGEIEWDNFNYWKTELCLEDGDLEIIGNIHQNIELI